MKKIILTGFLAAMVFLANAQSWNPFVNEGMISPDPVLPMEFEGKGLVAFNLGNTGSDAIEFDSGNIENNLRVVITLSNGFLPGDNAVEAIGGSWKGYFSWSYNEGNNTLTGIQNTRIPGDATGTVSVDYNVFTNTSSSVIGNGFGVALKVPSYMARTNHAQDDEVSSYTFTRAYDGGDAPESYGNALHEINFVKDDYTGAYERFIYLGKSVDFETGTLFSIDAAGDDFDSSDDEDGVTFPELIVGTTVKVPVTVTAHGESFGVLNAWFDWNGDGDFKDAGEKITTEPIFARSSGVYELSVDIPDDAVVDNSTYARFRIGANSDESSFNAWGEVEDYEIMLKSADAGIPELAENDEDLIKVEFYPNPVVNEYTIGIERNGKYVLQLYDILGRVTKTSEMVVTNNRGLKTLYRDGATSGIYFMKIEDELSSFAKTIKVIMAEQ